MVTSKRVNKKISRLEARRIRAAKAETRRIRKNRLKVAKVHVHHWGCYDPKTFKKVCPFQ